jgi:hypothetical protein
MKMHPQLIDELIAQQVRDMSACGETGGGWKAKPMLAASS